MGKFIAILGVLLIGTLTPHPHAQAGEAVPPATQEVETREQRDARMRWWREARFGMFIHWGVYAVPAGVYKGEEIAGIGEWIMGNAHIPVAEYADYAKQFNPVKFDADEWVRLAKDAGMKYIVITSKHHDGFAMYHSKASPYNIIDATPFDRDPLKELAEACREHDLKLGFYYSQAQDWHHPGGAKAKRLGDSWDPAHDGDMDEYIKTIAVPQVREILTNYGDLGILWWDTPANMTTERADLLRPLLKLQPQIITNNRLGGGYAGDYDTPEQRIPARAVKNRDWETCMTMNGTWGFKKNDDNWKPTKDLVRKLADIVSKGGNFLLNVGPTSEGEIPWPSVERLRAIGQWLEVNGDAIYGAKASPYDRPLPWGRITTKPGRLYLHVFDAGDGSIVLPGLENDVTRAWLLAAPESGDLTVTRSDEDVSIVVPPAHLDPIDTVVVVEIEGAPRTHPIPFTADANGVFTLNAVDAHVQGDARYESRHRKPGNIGFWTNTNDTVSWPLDVMFPGDYDVTLILSCDRGNAGSEYAVAIGDEAVKGTVPNTKGWVHYATNSVGTLRITDTGNHTLTVKALTKPGSAVMNLRSVILKPTTAEEAPQ